MGLVVTKIPSLVVNSFKLVVTKTKLDVTKTIIVVTKNNLIVNKIMDIPLLTTKFFLVTTKPHPPEFAKP